MGGFDLGVEEGGDYIELDVEVRLEEDVVVMDEDRVDGRRKGKGLVKRYTVDEVKKV
ncbi:glycerophosphodiester phosphodiesterase family protein, partial [Bacillus pumilus]|uniref:glycerophosphodiester phosphodiesterase family protein n=1 Tax=Bacillus pumilus TaxID=1408 RepID=UPI0034D97223